MRRVPSHTASRPRCLHLAAPEDRDRRPTSSTFLLSLVPRQSWPRYPATVFVAHCISNEIFSATAYTKLFHIRSSTHVPEMPHATSTSNNTAGQPYPRLSTQTAMILKSKDHPRKPISSIILGGHLAGRVGGAISLAAAPAVCAYHPPNFIKARR
jgi:hypothetical protein